ncbi:MAG: MgtC/SapB family protein [Butyricicoccus sp.]|nr:MgtC/SapB family protein [Butyricicoccus sp.]
MISYFDILARFLLAMLIGVIIGLQREHSQHPAGLRTHMLVALSACVVMTTGQLIMVTLSRYGGGFDPARMACQIIPGIGFLGAGSIIHARGSTKGITTAAGLWATACTGMCAGAGFYCLAILSAIIILVILSVLKGVRAPNGATLHTSSAEIKLVTDTPAETASLIRKLAYRYNGEASHIKRKQDDDSRFVGASTLVAHLQFMGTERDKNMEAFCFALSSAISSPQMEISLIRK